MAAPYVQRTIDADGQHRARVCGGNHEPLMAITEGIADKRDIRQALTLTLEALLADPELDRLTVRSLALAVVECPDVARGSKILVPPLVGQTHTVPAVVDRLVMGTHGPGLVVDIDGLTDQRFIPAGEYTVVTDAA